MFQLANYYTFLRTQRLGRPCLYMLQVDSTIDEAENKPPNTIVVAKQQTKGRGQRENVWISPPGCAMASVRMACDKQSYLATRICFLQHLLVMVAARIFEQIDDTKLGKNRIKFKWPNDIMYNDSTSGWSKIGGVLVHTTDSTSQYDITLSFGINVSNHEPTHCLNGILGPSKKVSIDYFIANMMNGVEESINDLDDDKFQKLKLEYKDRCLQMNQLVCDEKFGPVQVFDITEDGYLSGRRCEDDKICTVTKIITRETSA